MNRTLAPASIRDDDVHTAGTYRATIHEFIVSSSRQIQGTRGQPGSRDIDATKQIALALTPFIGRAALIWKH